MSEKTDQTKVQKKDEQQKTTLPTVWHIVMGNSGQWSVQKG